MYSRTILLLWGAVFFFLPANVYAAKGVPSANWDAFLDVGYRFSLLAEDELSELIAEEGGKYKQKLTEYLAIWEKRFEGKPAGKQAAYASRVYRRVSVAHLLVYLSAGQKKHLYKASQYIEGLAASRVTPRTVFWHNLVLAHNSLEKKDSLAFTNHVFRLWSDVVQVLEKGQVMFGTRVGTTGFNNSLPYLYENMVHLILYNGIVKHKLPNLYPLGTIIWALKGRLESDRGYYPLAESIWYRMHGITSDNFNVNFAMAILEGEMHWISFEGAKNKLEAERSFKKALEYFELALEWADTRKGKAAILSKLDQTMVRILNSMTQDNKLVSSGTFKGIPKIAAKYSEMSKELFRQLASKENLSEGWWNVEGFDSRDNYISVVRDLWLNTSQADIMIARHYRKIVDTAPESAQRLAYFDNAVSPLLNYLDFFDEFTTGGNLEIVPDSAYFFASYFAGELSELHRMKASYSNDMQEYNLAFARQLQAIEIFPLDIIGLLKLSHQVSQDGTLNTYIDNVWPLAERLVTSETVDLWAAKENLKYVAEIISLKHLIPETLKSTPSIIGIQTVGSGGKKLVEETLLLTHLLGIVLQSNLADKVDPVFEDISVELQKGTAIKKIFNKVLTPDVNKQLKPIMSLVEKSDYLKFKSDLFRNPDNIYHSVFRELYHEVAGGKWRYLKLLRTYDVRSKLRKKDKAERLLK